MDLEKTVQSLTKKGIRFPYLRLEKRLLPILIPCSSRSCLTTMKPTRKSVLRCSSTTRTTSSKCCRPA